MHIEQLTITQLNKVVPLFDAYRQFYGQLSDEVAATAFLRQRLEQQQSIIFVAKEKNRYVGFTQLYPTFSSVGLKKAYILNDLYVERESRKQGVAQQLMHKSFHYAKQQRAQFITLETANDNLSAQALYKKINMIEHTEKHYSYYF